MMNIDERWWLAELETVNVYVSNYLRAAVKDKLRRDDRATSKCSSRFHCRSSATGSVEDIIYYRSQVQKMIY